MAAWIKLHNLIGEPVLIPIDDIKKVRTPIRSEAAVPARSCIVHKSGGLEFVTETVAEIEAMLSPTVH